MSDGRLLNTQQLFQAYLLGKNRMILDLVKGSPTCSKEKCMQIYQDAYLSRLQDALKSDYPKLFHLLGQKKFDCLTELYILTHPSKSRTLRWFGENFPSYLSNQSGELSSYLVELASLEWSINRVFDEQDIPPLSVSVLGQIPPEHWANITLQFHPAFEIFDFEWNVATYWKALSNGRVIKPLKYQKVRTYIVWRQELEPYFTHISNKEAWALKCMLDGIPLAEVCSGLTTWFSRANAFHQTANYLKSWLNKGLIISIDV